MTTVWAPSCSAARTLRSSFGIGLAPHTRCEISRHGACTANTGISYRIDISAIASTSWLTVSAHTISSTPS